ncbi:MAG: LptA/OstA family protein [Pararhodobacter sp.]
MRRPSPTTTPTIALIAVLAFMTPLALPALTGTGAALAQAMQIRLGQSLQLTERALDITADSLEIDQSTGVTVFSGNVRATQGELRLRAGRVTLEYQPRADGSGQRIHRLIASGGVTLVTPDEAVEAGEAIYSLSAQSLDMRGDVVFVQGDNVLSGDRFTADLQAGTGQIQGRVRTIIRLD